VHYVDLSMPGASTADYIIAFGKSNVAMSTLQKSNYNTVACSTVTG
jgi:hypothetical protein